MGDLVNMNGSDDPFYRYLVKKIKVTLYSLLCVTLIFFKLDQWSKTSKFDSQTM